MSRQAAAEGIDGGRPDQGRRRSRVNCGALTARTGSIEVDGPKLSLRTPRDGVRAGIAYLPEERKTGS